MAWLLVAPPAQAQHAEPKDSLTAPNLAQRRTTLWVTAPLGAAGLYGGLGAAWYAGGLATPFRTFNDGGQWLQLDKVGHAYSAYQLSRLAYAGFRWAGYRPSQAAWMAPLAGFVLMLPIEVFDGFSPAYGASGWDLLANAAGAGLHGLNLALWQDERLSLKFSYAPSPYADQRPDLLGNTALTRILKDYNGQTYWLCLSLGAWKRKGHWWPAPLGLAVGYSGQGMLGGYGQDAPSTIAAREQRIWLIGLDLDLTRIPTNRPWLRTLLDALNAVRLPLPALAFSASGVELRPFGF